MIWRFLLDMLLVAALVVWLVPFAGMDKLSADTIALCLVLLIAFVVIGRWVGSGLIRLAFRVGLPVASIVTFVAVYGEGDLAQMQELFATLLTLLVVLAGFYIMLGGLRRKRE
ncbi:MAG: hypothetical protein ACREA0_15110 [bacterium]